MCFKSHLNCPLAAGKLAIFQADSYWKHMHIVGKKKAYRTIIQFKGEGHAMGGGGVTREYEYILSDPVSGRSFSHESYPSTEPTCTPCTLYSKAQVFYVVDYFGYKRSDLH